MGSSAELISWVVTGLPAGHGVNEALVSAGRQLVVEVLEKIRLRSIAFLVVTS
jgi:hypothetical protein